FSEYDTVFFGIGAERTEIHGDRLPNNYFNYKHQFGANSNSIPFTIGWARDTRDSALVPNAGRLQRVNLELSALGDVKYARANLQFQQYLPLTRQFTVAFNSELGLGKGLAGQPYPIFKNFFGGGLGSVRGFEQSSLGPVDVTGAFIGGTKRLNLNTELYLPVPGSGNDRTLRIFTYLDAGNVWGEHEKVDFSSLRASAGIGLSWVSPVGPLKISYGSPIRKQPGDRIERLQFQIGTAF
ncbi:MAG TPA: BamA/TamA family outer membrane protein, partial [Burkholderiaceae bacterium]